jgi:hypothetical protein
VPYFCYLLALRRSRQHGSRHANDSVQTSFELRDKLRSMRQRVDCPRKIRISGWGADTSFLALREMRLLFRSHSACAHQVDKRYYEKDRRYYATTRGLLVAVSRIGGDAADIGHTLDIYMNLWQSRAFPHRGKYKDSLFRLSMPNRLETLCLHHRDHSNPQPFDLQIRAKSNCCHNFDALGALPRSEESKRRGRLQ